MRVFFIINSRRRRRPVPSHLLQQLDGVLHEHKQPFRIALSESIDDSRRLVDEALRERYDTLWIGGGDGTINVLVNHSHGSGLTYGIVPMGTVNAFARAAEMPLDPVQAARYLLSASPVGIDLGEVNGRLFVCFASVGFDARVVHGVMGNLKRGLGRVAFVVSGLQSALHMHELAEFSAEGTGTCMSRQQSVLSQSGYSLILSNIANYAGFRLFHHAEPCSGTLEAYLFRQNRLWPMLSWCIASGMRGSCPTCSSKAVEHWTLNELSLRSSRDMYLQLDGEPVHLDDDRQYRFACRPGALPLLLHLPKTGG